jgi:hypothetical protein
MVFTEQQLQVKKLVDVQQDIEIDALNDGVNRVNANTVENAQAISDQSDRIDSIEDRVSNLEAEDTQIYNAMSDMSTSTAEAINNAVSGVMTSIGTQTTTAKVVATEGTIGSLEAGSVKIPLINSVTPVESHKILGYDNQGNVIPVEATYDLGVPSSAAFLKTDSEGEIEAGTPDTTVTEDSTNLVTSGAVYTAIDNAVDNVVNNADSTVTEDSTNLVTSGAVYTAIDNAADTLDSKIDSTADTLDSKIDSTADTLDSKIDSTAGGLSTRIDAIEQGQSLVIYNNPADNKVINIANQKVLMYDPITNKVWWTDVNIVPPMNSHTSGKVLSNASDTPEWVEITDADGVNVTNSNGVITIGIDSNKILAPAPTVSDANKVLKVNSNGDAASWEDETPQAETFLRAGVSNTPSNGATTNGDTYLKNVTNNTVDSQIKITGTNGVTISSTGNGELEITGTTYPILASNQYSSSQGYRVRGPGSSKATTDYFLAGDGTWQSLPANTNVIVGDSDATVNETSTTATDNTNTYIGTVENGTRTSGIQVVGSGSVEVYSESNGVLGIWAPSKPKTLGVDTETANAPVLVKYPANSKRNQSNYLRGDGSWGAPSILLPGLKNDDDNSNYSAGDIYGVYGPGSSKATANYVLAGNGNWVKGVPQPTSSDYGKTLKCNSSGQLYWG